MALFGLLLVVDGGGGECVPLPVFRFRLRLSIVRASFVANPDFSFSCFGSRFGEAQVGQNNTTYLQR